MYDLCVSVAKYAGYIIDIEFGGNNEVCSLTFMFYIWHSTHGVAVASLLG
jgi:hypothetical protein